MKMRSSIRSVCALTLGLAGLATVNAGVKWHFPVGLTYSSGFTDFVDGVEEMNFPSGFDNDFILPVGLSFQPYVEWDFGLGIGASVGPTSFLIVQTDTYFGESPFSSADYFSWIVPVGGYLRYSFFPDKKVSPYLKAGVRYPLAGGDFVGDATPGFYGAVGVELWRTKSIGLGLEVGYDSSELEIESDTGARVGTKTVKPSQVLVSIFAVF